MIGIERIHDNCFILRTEQVVTSLNRDQLIELDKALKRIIAINQLADISKPIYPKEVSAETLICTKPDCTCLEQAEEANDGQGVHDYPCLGVKAKVSFISPSSPKRYEN